MNQVVDRVDHLKLIWKIWRKPNCDLVLLGTVTGDKGVARAIIRDEKTKLEDLYQVGSEVQGAAISRISRGKVVLQVNGREEVLAIKDPENGDQDQGGAARMETRRCPGMAPNAPSRGNRKQGARGPAPTAN